MDNHPIPQDVTNFQFRLIGDMTIKQFGYIVGGVVLAWIMLAAPVFLLLRLLLAGSAIFIAVILAFIPIEGRPSDVMLFQFIKALFSPTQFVYQKSIPQVSQQPQQVVLTPQMPQQEVKKEEQHEEEKVQVESFTPIATAAVANHVDEVPEEKPAAIPTAPVTLPEQKQETALQQEVNDLEQALAEAKKQEGQEQNSTQATQAHEKVTTLEQELQDVLQQKQELEKQLVALQKSLAAKRQAVFTPTAASPAPQETQHVKKLPKQLSVGAGAPLVPDVPNLLSGIIKDPRGNVLSNMLIEVKDKDGNPVRAFKTNQLGQFSAATPLANGTYTISFEDPAGKQSFDAVEITADGSILSPLEITSVDAREKLRQELFGTAA